MTRTSSVAEQTIATADTSARRSRDSKAVGEGGAGEGAERAAFPELLTRLAGKEPGPGQRPASRAAAAEGADRGPTAMSRWRHIGHADDDGIRRHGGEVDVPAVGGDIDGGASADGASAAKSIIGGPLPLSLQPALLEFGLDEPRTAAGEARTGMVDEGPEGQDASALKVQSLARGTAAAAVVEMDVKISVIGRETHFAPTMLSSLLPRAVDRNAAPVSVGRAATAQIGIAAAIDAELSPEEVEAGMATSNPGTGVVRPSVAANAHGAGADQFDPTRAVQVPKAKADARTGGDTPGDRAAGGPVAGAEPRASSVGQPQPVLGLQASPVQQIADRIATELTAATAGRAPAAHNVPGASSSPGAQLRVLHIQLQPAELGTIEVRLSLKEDTLELRLEASRAEAAALIGRDKDALAGMLRSAGYLIDGLTVQIAEPDRSAGSTGQPGSQTPTPMQTSTQAQSGGAQADAQSERAHRQPQHDDRSNPANRDDNGSDQRTLRPVDGALYV